MAEMPTHWERDEERRSLGCRMCEQWQQVRYWLLVLPFEEKRDSWQHRVWQHRNAKAGGDGALRPECRLSGVHTDLT
jgi:hypothetical protein